MRADEMPLTRCDFCYGPEPEMIFPCAPFEFGVEALREDGTSFTQVHHSSGGWAVCKGCHVFVLLRAWEFVYHRWRAQHAGGDVSTTTRDVMIAYWQTFLRYQRGPAQPITSAMREIGADETVGRAEALRRAADADTQKRTRDRELQDLVRRATTAEAASANSSGAIKAAEDRAAEAEAQAEHRQGQDDQGDGTADRGDPRPVLDGPAPPVGERLLLGLRRPAGHLGLEGLGPDAGDEDDED